MKPTVTALGIALLLVPAGCMDKLEEQAKPTGSIIGKTTQEIGEFDPKAKQVVSDSKVRTDNDPILAPLQAYGPITEQISKLAIQNALATFNAINDRYPKDHKEFMDEIIKANGIKLPVLPAKAKYQYDVANHELVVVKAE